MAPVYTPPRFERLEEHVGHEVVIEKHGAEEPYINVRCLRCSTDLYEVTKEDDDAR